MILEDRQLTSVLVHEVILLSNELYEEITYIRDESSEWMDRGKRRKSKE